MKDLIDFAALEKPVFGIAADHGGFELKNSIVAHLQEKGIEITDFGPCEYDADDDYPDFGNPLMQSLSRGDIDAGILLCRSGVGMGITANRYTYARAAIANNEDAAIKSRDHNCSNILVTGGDAIESADEVIGIVDAWMATLFSQEDRHIRRLNKIETDSGDHYSSIREVDPDIAALMDQEEVRQENILEMIASENITSPAIRQAQGSILTNKYAEGYPGKRYYDGCEYYDDMESLAITRACDLFGAEAANVQAHSGSQANMAAYFTLIQPGDTILALDLNHGGHLTHGLKVNFSGKLYNIVTYGVDAETETLDYDEIERLAKENKPNLIVAGASAYPRVIDFPRFREIADSVGAYFMVDMAHIAGLVAAGVHPSPVPHAHIVTSTTHKTLRGPRSGLVLCKEEFLKKLNSAIFPGLQGGPLMHVIAAKAICFKEAMTDDYKAYQQQVVKNASVLADELTSHGFRIVSGGTDNHLLLVDLRPMGTTGNVSATALDHAGITVNKNLIPFDPEKPMVTSGLRIGTPALTTRGMKEAEMVKVAEWIHRVVSDVENADVQTAVKAEVQELTKQFPLEWI